MLFSWVGGDVYNFPLWMKQPSKKVILMTCTVLSIHAWNVWKELSIFTWTVKYSNWRGHATRALENVLLEGLGLKLVSMLWDFTHWNLGGHARRALWVGTVGVLRKIYWCECFYSPNSVVNIEIQLAKWTSIYLWRKVVCFVLFCSYEIHWTGML